MIKLEGCFTAIVTPFRNGKVDFEALKKIVRFQVQNGASGVVPCGSTGEAATLSPEEYLAVIKTAVTAAGGRIPVIPGVGTNSTSKSVEMVKKVSALGVDGLLAIVPYYNKPTQEGMKAHFAAVAGATKLPIILYNIPGRTGVNMLPATALGLRKKFLNIVGIKEASGLLDQVSELINGADKGFTVLSGDDSLTLPMMSVGARGVISVASNIAPAQVSSMCRFFLDGNLAGALRAHHHLFPLIKTLFVETNPIPVKYAASLLGLCLPEPRLPLTPLTPKNRAKLKKSLAAAGIKRCS
ncbi:MAG: 4-hydroxy-tetrahydrodipicolinate synthase [Elusimicrobia bacterium CG_4_10_14_0_2_um_filter_56_8]|nr:MAG: 4-hydroxy-tetrahydrodipicolinate synthase [Elusimicrobia bacterium CG_4_10_14_0_2_um_filter_56_8]